MPTDRNLTTGTAWARTWVVITAMAIGGYSPPESCAAEPPAAELLAAEPPAAAVSMTATGSSGRDRFAVQTTVRSGDRVIATHRTAFRDGVAVQWKGDGSEFLTIFDDDSVVLLDRSRGVQSEISHQQLVDLTLRAAAVIRDSPEHQKLGVDIAPQRQNDLYLASFGPFNYRLQTIAPEHPQRSVDFAAMADASLRLNLIRGGTIPPFARLAISREMVRDGRVPIRTTLSIDPDRTLVSVNQWSDWTERDTERYDAAMSMRRLYQTVAIDQISSF